MEHEMSVCLSNKFSYYWHLQKTWRSTHKL